MMEGLAIQGRRQSGLAAFTYLLAVVVLSALVTGVVLLSGNRVQAAEQQWTAAAAMIAQANLLRAKILDCAAQSGDNATANHKAYPVGTAVAVSTLACPTPGAPNIFTGTDSVFVPPPPNGFAAWSYTNDASNVRLQLVALSAANAGAYNVAMNKAAASLGIAASIVTSTMPNDTLQIILTN